MSPIVHLSEFDPIALWRPGRSSMHRQVHTASQVDVMMIDMYSYGFVKCGAIL